MYCSNCGKEIDNDSKFCQFCGTSVGISSNNQDKNSANQNQIKENAAHNTTKKEVLLKKYCYFNWGAFGFTWFHAFLNRMPNQGSFLLFLNILLVFLYCINFKEIMWIVIILNFVLVLCYGFNANTWAWENYPYNDMEQFIKGQDKWNVWGIFYILFIISVWLASFWFLGFFQELFALE